MADDWDQFAQVSPTDALNSLTQSGIEVTSGFRTQADNERLAREGYHPAPNSHHLDGDAVDLTPGKSGMSFAELEQKARQVFGPNARFLNEGDHLHVTVPGWGGAPDTYRSDEWSEFDVVKPAPKQASATAAPEQPAAQTPEQPSTDPTERTIAGFSDELPSTPAGAQQFHDALYQQMASGKLKSVEDAQTWADAYNKANGTDFGVNDSPNTRAAFAAAAAGKQFGVATPTMTRAQEARLEDRRAAAAETGKSSAVSAGALDSAALGAFDEASALGDAVVDTLHGKGFDYTGNLNADRAFLHGVEQDHPGYYIAGQLAGGLVLPTFGDLSTVANMAKTGAVEGGIYGFNSSDGTLADRAENAAIGAGAGAVAGPVIGKAIEGGTALVRRVIGRNGAEEAAGAPLEGEIAPEATAQPPAANGPENASEAAMGAEPQPSVASEPVRQPDRIDVGGVNPEPGTPEQRIAAAQATPEDLVPAAPVATEAPEEAARAANINLSKLASSADSPADIEAAMKFTADTFGNFDDARRGVLPWNETNALADKLGMDVNDLLGRGKGEAWNAERIEGANRLLDASAAKLIALRDAAISGGEAEKAAFIKGLFLHAAVTEQAAGLRAEAGRALNILKKVSRAGLNDHAAIESAVQQLDKGASVDDVIRMVDSLKDDPAALNDFVRNAVKPRFKDKLMFVWVNALLSGPKTHIVNMASNLLTALMDVPEHAVAAGLGAVRRLVNRQADAVLMSEIGPRFFGTLRGAADGLAAIKKGLTEEAGGKTDQFRPAIGGKAGDIISIPTRLLNAEDEMFKAIARRSELAGMAVRTARMEGLKGEALANRVDVLLQHPTDAMLSAAADAALYKTFQRPLGRTMQKISTAIQSAGWPKLFVPFIRTPTNLLKYAIERSPAAPILKEVRDEFIAGGAKRDLAIARMTLGTGTMMLVASQVASGRITGNGPADPSARKALEANGWQPYSVKIGDTYVSYRRLDPWATVIGTAADLVELQSAMTDKQQQDMGALLIGATTQNLASKTWLSGLSDFLDAVTDPQANAKNTITRLAASVTTPTLSSQIAQMLDPIYRDTNDPTYLGAIRKRIESRIPGASRDLIARRDILGNEVRDADGPIARLISPFDTSKAKNDPVARAIYDSGARFSVPSRKVSGGNLSDRDYDNYQKVAAQYFYDDMAKRISDSDWQGMPRDARAKEIERIKNRARKDARTDLFG